MQKKCENFLKMKGEQNEKDFAVNNGNTGKSALFD